MSLSAFAGLPSVSLKNLDGKTVDTATLSNDGKPMVISFFALWCKPCQRELKAIAEVYDEWQEETGVKLIAVSIDEAQNEQKVKPLVESKGWEYEVLLDPNGGCKDGGRGGRRQEGCREKITIDFPAGLGPAGGFW